MITKPLHRRWRPTKKDDISRSNFESDRIDLNSAHLDPYSKPDEFGDLPDLRPLANSSFDKRAAAAVIAEVGEIDSIIIEPLDKDLVRNALLERKKYARPSPDAIVPLPIPIPLPLITILTPTAKCLAALAYLDFFQNEDDIKKIKKDVSDAIMLSSPGFCGTFGPGVTGSISLAFNTGKEFEGNYDMTQMWLLPLVYNYYDELRPEARERLITVLLQKGMIARPNKDTIFTSGGVPNDWERAGFVSPLGVKFNIPETENHVLMIATVRYLTNQLLYQRDHDITHDNRRNGDLEDSRPSCLDQVLGLLRNYLWDDFAEYNAKGYSGETRRALLNLCSYAYDAEVRLGARMVLDFISARIAVSSNDLRRMVPFRRRNDGKNIKQFPKPPPPGFMNISLRDGDGADPVPPHFALLAGNTRAYRTGDGINRRWRWAIHFDFGKDLTLTALSDYRLPPSLHDLFVNDFHRRFFQRLHRVPLEERGDQRNCDNMEIYAGSPSYLITAGGEPVIHAIPGAKVAGIRIESSWKSENIGVAVPISFMATGLSEGSTQSMRELAKLVEMSAPPISLIALARRVARKVREEDNIEVPRPFFLKGLYTLVVSESRQLLIQLFRFSDNYAERETANYGVAPDFACGFSFHLPAWTGVPHDKDGVFFVDKKSHNSELAGFFLAIIKQDHFMILEAFDTWHHPEISLDDFKQHVTTDNPSVQFRSGQETVYTTFFGNKIHFVIWNKGEIENYKFGSKIFHIEYASGENPNNTLIDAGDDQSQFLSGNILKSTGDAAMEINNPQLRTKIKLDWSDPTHLMRTSEDGKVEHAGKNDAGQLYEVWVDFDWNGNQDGDFYHPFKTLPNAIDAVADGGTIKIMPGTSGKISSIHSDKTIRLSAPTGGVTISNH